MRHSAASAIALSPFALLLLISAQARATSAATHQSYAQRMEQTWKEAKTLDQQFLDLQRAYTLISHGEDKIITPSLLREHVANIYDTPALEQASLAASLANIRDAVTYLRARMAALGSSAMHIDLSKQQLTLIGGNGTITAAYPVSSGARETPTPVGVFQIYRKQTLRVSNLDPPYRMPYYMAFTEDEGYGLHALPYLGGDPQSSDYWQEARSHIGIPVSHGCVRLLPEHAEKVFEWAERGTRVYIHA